MGKKPSNLVELESDDPMTAIAELCRRFHDAIRENDDLEDYEIVMAATNIIGDTLASVACPSCRERLKRHTRDMIKLMFKTLPERIEATERSQTGSQHTH